MKRLNIWWKEKTGYTLTTYTRKYHSGELTDAIPPHVVKAIWNEAIESGKKPKKSKTCEKCGK